MMPLALRSTSRGHFDRNVESLPERRAAAHLADADGTGEDHPLTTMNFDTDLFLFLKKIIKLGNIKKAAR
jgi:hypothetical protein